MEKMITPSIAVRVIIVNQKEMHTSGEKSFLPLNEIWCRCLPEIIEEEAHKLSRELYAPIVPTVVIAPRFQVAGELLKTTFHEFHKNYIIFITLGMYTVAKRFKESFAGLGVVVFTEDAGLGKNIDEHSITLISRAPKH